MRRPTSRFADVYAQRASQEGVPPALRQWPHGDARRHRAGGAARSVDAESHHRSRQARRRYAGAAHRFDRDGVPRSRRNGVRHRRSGLPPKRQREGGCTHVFSERFECQNCNLTYEAPQPRLFSFNNPFGACPTCHGFGNIIELDLDLVVPDPAKSIQQGAIEPWTKTHYRAQLAELKRAAKPAGVSMDIPWKDLNDEEKRFIVEGDGKGLRRHSRVLPLARAQEVQGARPRVPQPVSRAI